MSKKSFGIKLTLGFDNAETIMSLLNLAVFKLTRALELRDVSPEYRLSNIEIIDNKDFSYSIILEFDNEHTIQEIVDKTIIGGFTNE